jgi:exodeoxyribonuclease V alpha subunit
MTGAQAQHPIEEWLALAGVTEPLDLQLATTVVRRGRESGERGAAVALAVALLSRALREGHSALSTAELARQARQGEPSSSGPVPTEWPISDEGWWSRTLTASALVSDGAGVTPLVLRGGLLQFRRYHDAEGRIADRILALAATLDGAKRQGFSIITGGPGTGKTTLVARTLAELLVADPAIRVALAAPTGKAAARLTESIRLRWDERSRESGTKALTPIEARTVHRLLRYSQSRDRFLANERDPLDEDLVIVDEASMVDVLMLDALLRALKPGGRLILVGDHHQLSSVDAGDVLGALCRAAAAAAPTTPLGRCITTLTKNWRFEEQPGISRLAAAILSGDAKATIAACNGASEVRLLPPAEQLSALLKPVEGHLERCLAADSPAAALAALESFRILAPERDGALGVNGINAAVERWLARRGRGVQTPWYHGRAVLVTANDYAAGVFNGDLGVVWRSGDTIAVHFRAPDGATRTIAPLRLPAVETAWGMTVHKAQGSEFDDVLVVIPERESRVMSRELLYTAVTRARKTVTLIGTEAAVVRAMARGSTRSSGLGLRLV